MIEWPPRDGRRFIALAASVMGAIALTFFAAWIVWIVWQGDWPGSIALNRLDWLGYALMLSLGGALLVLASLGLAINKRTVKAGRDGFEVSGGDE